MARPLLRSLLSSLKESAVLKLKKLQILGFKAVCDRTELKFPGDGIAAVVGPNGCGKSNIADAISWVLGEQSAKSLRGVRMEDVIFAGTRERKPTGMAEVSLTLVDPQVYEGPVSSELQIDIQDELPEDDWDEASFRETAAQATETATAEVQPGPLDQVEAAADENQATSFGEPSDEIHASEAPVAEEAPAQIEAAAQEDTGTNTEAVNSESGHADTTN